MFISQTFFFFTDTRVIQFLEKCAKINAVVFWIKRKTEGYLVTPKIKIKVIIRTSKNQ